jgi:hypothetical protein
VLSGLSFTGVTYVLATVAVCLAAALAGIKMGTFLVS